MSLFDHIADRVAHRIIEKIAYPITTIIKDLFNPGRFGEVCQLLWYRGTANLDGSILDEKDNNGDPRTPQSGLAIDFDGTNDYISCGSISTLTAASAFIECSFIADVANGNDYLVANSLGGSSASNTIGLKLEGNTVRVNLGDGSTFQVINTTLTVSTGTAYRVRTEISGANLVTTLTNISTGVETSNTTAMTVTPASNAHSWSIGQFGTSNVLQFNGKIWDVRIGDATGTLRWYKLEDARGDTAYDSSGNDVHGTLTNSPTRSTQNVFEPFLNEVGFSLSPNNLFDYSQDFSQTYWFKGTSGDGTADASSGDGIDLSTTSSGRAYIQRNGISVISGQKYRLRIRRSSLSGSTTAATISISGGASITSTDYTSEVLDMDFTPTANVNILMGIGTNTTGSGAASMTIDSVQLYEIIGDFEVPYAETTGTSFDFLAFVPRDESNVTQDVLGNPLGFSGKVPRNAQLKAANCISLDGVNDYVQAPVLGSTTLVNKLFLRFRPNAEITTTSSSQYLVGTTSFFGLVLGATTGLLTNETITIATNASHRVGVLNTNISADWHTLEIRWNGSNYDIYLDGEQQAVTSVGTPARLDAQNFRLGRRGTGSDYYNGLIADVQVYDDNDELIRYHPFSEGAGTTCYDVSDNMSHSSLVNGVAWSTQDVFHWNYGKGHSRYMYFDGVNDYIGVGTDIFNSHTQGYVEASILTGSSLNSQVIFSAGSATNFTAIFYLVIEGSNLRIFHNGNSQVIRGNTTLTTNTHYKVRFESDGSTYSMFLNDVEETLTIVSGTNNGNWFADEVSGSMRYSIGNIRRSTGDIGHFGGVIYDVVVNDGTSNVAEWQGRNNTNSGWKDNIGSNDGIVNGSPSALSIPALNDGTADALMQPIRDPQVIPANWNNTENTLDTTGGNATPITSIGSWATAGTFPEIFTGSPRRFYVRDIEDVDTIVAQDQRVTYCLPVGDAGMPPVTPPPIVASNRYYIFVVDSGTDLATVMLTDLTAIDVPASATEFLFSIQTSVAGKTIGVMYPESQGLSAIYNQDFDEGNIIGTDTTWVNNTGVRTIGAETYATWKKTNAAANIDNNYRGEK